MIGCLNILGFCIFHTWLAANKSEIAFGIFQTEKIFLASNVFVQIRIQI